MAWAMWPPSHFQELKRFRLVLIWLDCSVSDPLQSATTVDYLIFFQKKIFLHRHMLAGQCCNDCSDQTELGVFDVKLSRMWYLGIDSHKKKEKCWESVPSKKLLIIYTLMKCRRIQLSRSPIQVYNRHSIP